MQSLNGKVTGDSLTAAEWNQVPSELQNIITNTGQSLSAADLNQLGKGVAAYASVSDFYTSSGPANAYVLTSLVGYQSPVQYTDGMRVRFVPNINNTGASVTISVGGLGSRSVVREDGLGFSSGNEFNTSRISELYFDASANNFKVRDFRFASQTVVGVSRFATQTEVNNGTGNNLNVSPQTLEGRSATEARTGIAEIATQTEVNNGSDDARIVTPLKLATRLSILGSDDIDNDSTVAGASVTAALDALSSSIPDASGIISDSVGTTTNIPNATPVDVMTVTSPSGYTGGYQFVGYINFDNLDANTIQIQLTNYGAITLSSISLIHKGSGGDNDVYYRGGDVNSGNSSQLISVSNADITDSFNTLVKIEGRLLAVGDGAILRLQVRNTTASSTVVARSGSSIQFIPLN